MTAETDCPTAVASGVWTRVGGVEVRQTSGANVNIEVRPTAATTPHYADPATSIFGGQAVGICRICKAPIQQFGALFARRWKHVDPSAIADPLPSHDDREDAPR